MGAASEALKDFLGSRTTRERRIIAAGLALALLAALYALFWEPGLAATRRLSAQLPRMRADVEEMRLHQKRIAALRESVGAAQQGGAPRALLQATLDSDPSLRGARAQWLSRERVSLEIAAIDFDQWLAMAARLQRESGIRVESCTVAALPQAGLVRVEAVLAAPETRAR